MYDQNSLALFCIQINTTEQFGLKCYLTAGMQSPFLLWDSDSGTEKLGLQHRAQNQTLTPTLGLTGRQTDVYLRTSLEKF